MIEENSGRETTNYLDVIVFEKLRFQNGFRLHAKPPFSNSSGLKSLSLVRCDIESTTRREIPYYGRPCIIYHISYKTLGPGQWISWLFN